MQVVKLNGGFYVRQWVFIGVGVFCDYAYMDIGRQGTMNWWRRGMLGVCSRFNTKEDAQKAYERFTVDMGTPV